ncbi:hypothetical protein LY90DRAFT_702963 [Neocallimastix californiae]|uniref:Cation/H+ exchanger transmembrane domain-containing protein n=1 Tax=Neocallimastix californiae TaxID=1754190 RepID=A0A1Y2CT20_9FUNG|nr:hypothetical protein LY90DRAFT_702963 [Neocallimastix californiae]|eukprot:ORY50161.1 hypothetical protein LY90DRAFT_702963 [Neocallimastix californiae]
MPVKGGLFGNDNNSYLATILLQMLIIISLSRVLVWLLSKIGQPSIIGQILCGIILGPSVLGHIPGFMNTFFPKDSIENLFMVSDFTLILYVFLVGLELNPSLAMSFILKDEDHIHGTKNTITHMLYFGLVLSISALPVLSRIISELGLLQTVVGASSVSIIAMLGLIIVVSSFINSTDDTLSSLYIFLCLMAAVLFMVIILKPLINLWLKHYQNVLEQDGAISEFIISFMFILLLLFSWTTHRFGGHAVIGSFYIAASGLRSNFDFTSDYMFWIWLVIFFIASSIGKILAASLVARLCKFSWRESFSIGILLNTKGLMDLVVLNMGFDSSILTDKTYTLFILITILTTFSTSSLISKVYSPKYRVPMTLNAPMNVEFNEATEMTNDDYHSLTDSSSQSSYYKLLFTVTNTKSLPGLMTMLHLLNSKITNDNNGKIYNQSKLMAHVLRIVEFSERSSTIQMATDATTTTNLDPISGIIRTFGQLNNINIIANLIVIKPSDFASTLSFYAENLHSNILIITYDIADNNYLGPTQSGYLTLANIFENQNDQSSVSLQVQQMNSYTIQQKTLRSIKSEYLPAINQFLRNSNCPVGIYIDRGFGQGPAMMLNSLNNNYTNETTYGNTVSNLSNVNLFAQTVMIIFIGGPDDREALKLVTRIAKNNRVHVIIKRIRPSNEVKSPIVETTIEENYINDGLTFQPNAIKSTSLQTYQKMLSNLTERKSLTNSNRNTVTSNQIKRNSTNMNNNEIIELNDYKSDNDNNDNINNNNKINSKENINKKFDSSNNIIHNLNSRENSVDSFSVLSKPSIAVSISSSEKSSKSNSHDDLSNVNKNNEDIDVNKKLPSVNGTSIPSNSNSNSNLNPNINSNINPNSISNSISISNSPKVNEITPITVSRHNTDSKPSSLKKRGTILSKIIRSRKNTSDNHNNTHQSLNSLKELDNENGNENNEEDNKSTESFSIEIEIDTYEDRAAFSELKKLLNKDNTHLSIEDITLGSNDQLNDICVDLAHSIGKKDLLIIGRENILPDINNNNLLNNNPDTINVKQPSNEVKNKNEISNDNNGNSYDQSENTESNIQKTVSTFVSNYFYSGNTTAGNNNLQEEARLRTMAGSLGYRVIKECSASIMIVQASKYKGYDRTMDDITEMEEEKIVVKRRFSLLNRKGSMKKVNSFKDHIKLSNESIELENLNKRKSSSIRSNSRNENINAITIKNIEDKHQNVNINISEIVEELDNNGKNNTDIIEEEQQQQPTKSRSTNKIMFDIDDHNRNSIQSNHSNNSQTKNEINILNINNFSRNNTLSSRDELERERIKKIIHERDTYLNNEIHQDIADSDVLYLGSGDELDNSDTGL